MACETLQFFRSVCEVGKTNKSLLLLSNFENTSHKRRENQRNSVSGCADSFTLMISFVFSHELFH